MKKYLLSFLFTVACALVVIQPIPVQAESGSSGSGSDDDSGRPNTSEIRERLRVKKDGVEIREEYRAKLNDDKPGDTRVELRKEVRMMGTSTPKDLREVRAEARQELKDNRLETRTLMKLATSSDDRRELRRDLRKDQFEAHKNILVRQLNLALTNLKQIRDRIAARITKAEEAGRNMTQAKTALTTADAKITAAEEAIADLVAFVPTNATSTMATSTDDDDETVELAKPRQVGQTAIQAVKNAREALNLVVRAIAHAMGLGDDRPKTPTTGTTTDTTATTTP